MSMTSRIVDPAVELGEELRKLPAFFRRDWLTMWSYRFAFFSDWMSILIQVFMFYFLSQLIDPSQIPAFGGTQVGYLQFVILGIAVIALLQLGLTRVASVIREEQMMGTLESLLISPTSITTIQLGSVIHDLFYVPIRTGMFLVVISWVFQLDFVLRGLWIIFLILPAFIVFVWGVGMIGAAAALTLRRGAGIVGFAGTLLTLTAGAYFPLEVMPEWAETIARANPVAIVLESTRGVLLGGDGLGDVWISIVLVALIGIISITLGIAAIRWAIRRERSNGTLGMY